MKLTLNNQDQNLKMVNQERVLKILNLAANYITEQYPEAAEQSLSICMLAGDEMAELNESFVGHEGTTDVITFDFRDELCVEDDEEDFVGEIYVCPAVAWERASEFGNRFEEELVLYMVHGLLHLFGYDDKTDEDQEEMTKAENRSMKRVKEEDSLEGIFAYNG